MERGVWEVGRFSEPTVSFFSLVEGIKGFLVFEHLHTTYDDESFEGLGTFLEL